MGSVVMQWGRGFGRGVVKWKGRGYRRRLSYLEVCGYRRGHGYLKGRGCLERGVAMRRGAWLCSSGARQQERRNGTKWGLWMGAG